MGNKEQHTLAELLEDDYFVSSIHRPTSESDAYWASLIEEGKVSREDFELGRLYIQNLPTGNTSLTTSEISGMWTTILTEGKRRRKNRTRRLYLFSIAAACILVLTGVFLFEKYNNLPGIENTTQDIDIAQVARPEYNGDEIRIVLSDDNHILVEENNSEIIYNDQGEARVNSSVVREAAGEEEQTSALKFNQVIIPRGKFSSLTLSDGTKLWLNAHSRVVYPPVFSANERKIFIEGEAYMEVTHDSNRPFIVKTSQMEIEVLGTEFNISAYEGEDAQSVVLVSGSVSVKTMVADGAVAAERVVMSPSQLYRLTGGKAEMKTVNVNKYISWKEGYYWLESERLSYVFARLSNYYGIQIEYDKSVGEMPYTGKLDLKHSPDRVLGGLGNTAPIRLEKRGNTYYMSYKP